MSVNNVIYIDGKRYTVNCEKLSSHGYIELTVGHKRPCERAVTAPLYWWRNDEMHKVFTSGEWLSKQPDKEENMTDWNSISSEKLDQHTPGAKLDHDKVDMSLLQFLHNALLEVCHVMDYGQTKYSRGGFLEVDDAINRYTAAMWRHYLKECSGELYDQGDPFYDTPKGLPFKGTLRHDAQLAVNALFRLEYRMREEKDQATLKFKHKYININIDDTESPDGVKAIDKEFDDL